mgnify:CR=1 FL=1
MKFILYIKLDLVLKQFQKKNNMRWMNTESIGKRNYDELSKRAIRIWQKSSSQMEDFSKQKKFFYLQVMLPNKFFGNKDFSSEEKKYLEKHEYSEVIKKFYGLKNFKNINVKHSLDLRSVFKNINQTVYTRDCCDYNNYGMTIISDKIIEYLNINFIDLD